MSNTLTNVNYIAVFKECLEAFKKTLEPMSIFSTQYSNEPGFVGATTYVPVVSAKTAADGSLASTDYESGDSSAVSVAVTLSANYWSASHLLAIQASQTQTDAFKKWMMEATYAVAAKCMLGAQDLITTGYTNASAATAATAIDDDKIVDYKYIAHNTMKFKPGSYNIVLDSAYFANLEKDPAVRDFYANPNSTANIYSNKIVRHGIPVWESLSLADSTPYSGANLRGYIVHPSAMGLTIRPPAILGGTSFNMVENITDPDTGLTLQYREWVKPGTNTLWGVVEVLFGGARVRTDGLYRIVSA